jgi:PAS domain S-box-containing protein
MTKSKRRLLAPIGAIALVAAIWFATAEATSSAHLTHHPTHVWMPSGIALGIAVLVGEWTALGVAIGSLAFLASNGVPTGQVVLVSLIKALEVALGSYLLLHVAHFRPAMDRVRDVIALLVVALFVSFAGATAGVSAMLATPTTSVVHVLSHWPSWLWSHLTAYLILTPLVVTLGTRTSRPMARSQVELVILAIAVLVVSVVVFDHRIAMRLPVMMWPYYLFPLLVWTGLRHDSRVAAVVNGAVAAAAFGGWTMGVGPIDVLADYQGFVMIAAVTTLVLSALRAEHTRAVMRKAAVQEAALDAIISIDAHGMIVEWNPAAVGLFGVAAGDALGRDAIELIVPPVQRGAVRDGLAWHTRPDGDGWVDGRVRYPLRRADGQEFPAEIALTRLQIQGEMWFTAFVRDITAERVAEDARRESRELLEHKVAERTAALSRVNVELQRRDELLRQAQALAQVGSYDFDIFADRIEWSDEFAKILGRDPAMFRSPTAALQDALHPDDVPRVSAAIKAAMTSRQGYSVEARIVRPDGTVLNTLSRGRVVVDDEGRMRHIIGYIQDITERERAEQARRRLVHLVESSADAIFVLALDGRIETWNAAASRIFGYTADEVIGHHVSVLVPEDKHGELEEILAAVRAGQTRAHYELRHRRRDGYQFDASLTISVILDDEGRLVGLSKVLRDITDQKAVEQKIRQSLREKEILLREIHHRVKNNLQVISSLLNLQVERVGSASARSALTESQDRIRSMALVHQMLYRSKDLAHIHFVDYLRTVVDSLVRTYRDETRTVVTEVTGPEIQLDIDRAISCGLIVTELVTNALRHAFPKRRSGHVVVAVSVRESHIVLEVKDDGVGMPDHAQLDAMPTFGLQITRALTQQLEGKIDITNGTGTTVRIVFPQAVKTENIA